MKTLDLVVWTLLAIGGVNWGLIGFFNVDLVAMLFGSMTMISRLIYAMVGLAAIYDIFFITAIWKRWDMHLFKHAHA